MKTKNIFSLALLGLLVLPLAAAKDPVVVSKWAATPVQIDGQGTEWTPEEMVAIQDVNAKFAVKNDDKNIYVLLNLENPQFQSSIQQTGITFWINSELKSKKVYGVHLYPKAITADGLIKELESQGQTLTAERKAEIQKQKEYLLYACDTVNKKNKVIPHDVKLGIGMYRMAQVQRAKVFEITIPLALLDSAENGVKIDPSKPFKLGLEWGGMTEEMRALRAAQMGDRVAQASGEGLSSESLASEGDTIGGQGGGGSLSAMRRGIPPTYIFWVDLTIASNK